jgi:hypothetical protein
MADLEQIPGELNLSFVGGDDFIFTATISGDYSAHTHSAKIYDGNKEVASFTVVPVYLAPNSTMTFTLTDTQTLSAIPSALSWYYTQTLAGITRTILSGTVEVVKR